MLLITKGIYVYGLIDFANIIVCFINANK